MKLSSPGPVIFSQAPVGKDGRVFRFYKFRSMRMNAESEREILKKYNESTGPVFKIKEDPRLTPVGRFIRRTSIDEHSTAVECSSRGHESGRSPPPDSA